MSGIWNMGYVQHSCATLIGFFLCIHWGVSMLKTLKLITLGLAKYNHSVSTVLITF